MKGCRAGTKIHKAGVVRIKNTALGTAHAQAGCLPWHSLSSHSSGLRQGVDGLAWLPAPGTHQQASSCGVLTQTTTPPGLLCEMLRLCAVYALGRDDPAPGKVPAGNEVA